MTLYGHLITLYKYAMAFYPEILHFKMNMGGTAKRQKSAFAVVAPLPRFQAGAQGPPAPPGMQRPNSALAVVAPRFQGFIEEMRGGLVPSAGKREGGARGGLPSRGARRSPLARVVQQ